MANIDLKILEAAYKDGVFSKSPNDRQRLYLKASVISAWDILELIKYRRELGIEGNQIAEELDLNINTINTFLRWLTGKKLIEFETPKGDQAEPKKARIYHTKQIKRK